MCARLCRLASGVDDVLGSVDDSDSASVNGREVQAVFFLTRNLRIGLERIRGDLRKARRFIDEMEARQKSVPEVVA